MVRLIEDALAGLLVSQNTGQSATILAELREKIGLADPAAAASAIAGFLKSGSDASTRLPLALGPGGVLKSAPTLRTALLDLLPTLDPTLALAVAREIMDSKKSPDEYAIALRNLAWNDLDGDLTTELIARFEQMIEMDDWRKKPSAGFLEGMDAAVEISDERTFGVMLALNAEAARDQNSSLARASFIALDRMSVRQPSLLVKSYQTDPLMSGISPDQRASLMSRLDLNDPTQRGLFAKYLGDPQKGPQELDYFTEIFPNGNYLHGNWLITTLEPTHSIDSRRLEDQQVLRQIETLLAENASQQTNQALVRIRENLRSKIQN